MIEGLDSVKGAIELFEKKQDEFSNFGASDTEPDGIFQSILMQALDGIIKIPITKDGWDLYSSMPGSGPAAKQLSKFARIAANVIKDAVHNSDDPTLIRKYVDEYCWRI
jgi:hypothetical protein